MYDAICFAVRLGNAIRFGDVRFGWPVVVIFCWVLLYRWMVELFMGHFRVKEIRHMDRLFPSEDFVQKR